MKRRRHTGPCPGQEGPLYVRIMFSPTRMHTYFTCKRGGGGGQARPEGTRDEGCEEGRWGGPGCLWHVLQPPWSWMSAERRRGAALEER